MWSSVLAQSELYSAAIKTCKYPVLLQIVVYKQLPRIEIELAAFRLLEKRHGLSPRETRHPKKVQES